MTEHKRTDEVLRFFVDRYSGQIGRTFLVKLAYMADYQSHRYLGRPLSGLTYAVDNHGPFDQSFYRSIERLKSAGSIDEVPVDFGFERLGRCFYSRRSEPYSFDDAELAVLTHIAGHFAGTNLNHILDVVYETEPFVQAEQLGRGARLPMTVVDGDGTKECGGIRLEGVMRGLADLSAGRTIALEDWERGISG